MKLTSSAFNHGDMIPAQYTCDGENISPELSIHDLPQGTKSLVLIMEDPDVPTFLREDGMWDHWVVFNISPDIGTIPEGTEPHGMQGRTTSGTQGYGGPCPPDREHRYFFMMYALSAQLDEQEGITKEVLKAAMRHHILEKSELMGRYVRADVTS